MISCRHIHGGLVAKILGGCSSFVLGRLRVPRMIYVEHLRKLNHQNLRLHLRLLQTLGSEIYDRFCEASVIGIEESRIDDDLIGGFCFVGEGSEISRAAIGKSPFQSSSRVDIGKRCGGKD